MFLEKFEKLHQNRVFGLDLMRAMAIVMVILGHTRWLSDSFPRPIDKLFHGSGILGVELFFVLSGFLIGRILLNQFMKNPDFGWKEIKEFWIRRWFRTLPAYFLILTTVILVYPSWVPSMIWKYYLFLQNYVTDSPRFYGESWTLSLEEHTYLVAPLALVGIAFLLPKTVDRAKVFLYSAIAVILTVIAIRTIWVYSFPELFEKWDTVRRTVVFRLDTIFYGFIAAVVSVKYPGAWRKFRIPALILGLIIVLPVLVYYKQSMKGFAALPWQNAFIITLINVSVLLMLPFFAAIKEMKVVPVRRVITFVSVISYSLYLLNDTLISRGLYESLKPFTPTFPLSGIMYVGYLTVTLAASYYLYMYFERPMTNLRNQFAPDKSKKKSISDPVPAATSVV
ncbi:MAG: acyltransferase [Bacteroidota bacterium]